MDIAFDAIRKAVRDEAEQEPKISPELFKQVTKERDIAIEQLHELGYEFGEKIEPTTKNDLGVDCIDRAQAQTEIEMNALRYTIAKERGGMGQVEWSDQLIKVSDAVDIIRNLPPVTPQEPRWIPVTEKLPEEKTAVLLSCDDMYLAKLNPCIGWISGNNWYTFSARGSYLVKYPVAWMPLPEPYKGGQEE